MPVFAQTVPSTPATEAAPAAVATPDESIGDGDIVVTANRRSESLQRVPLAVSALTAESLQDKGITSLASLATQATPGLVVVPFAGQPSTLAFNIRGAASADPGVGLAEQGVSVYADGVPLGRAVGLGVELGDLERIEILRGPQGTLFGRNAEGGAVQFISKKPTGELGGRVEGTIGNFDTRRVVAHLDLPSFGNVAVKISGLIDRHDGYTRNLAARPFDSIDPSTLNDFGYKNQKGFRTSVYWTPSSDFSALYSFDYSDLKFTPQYTIRTGGRVPAEPAFCAVPAFAGFCASPATLGANLYRNTRGPDSDTVPDVSDVPLFNRLSTNKTRGHTLTLDYQASDNVQLKSITGYRTLKEDSLNTLGTSIAFVQFVPSSLFSALPAGTQVAATSTVAFAQIDQNQFSQELQVIATFGKLDLTAGFFYYNEHVKDFRDSAFNTVYVSNGTNDPTAVAVNPFPLSPSGQRFDATANSFATYAQGTYHLTEELSLTAGLRFTHDEKFFNRTEFASAPDDAAAPPFRESRVDPAFTIAYQATPDLNLYLRYAQAYRAGGVGIRDKLSLNTYESEVNRALEGGIKAQLFDRRVRFNLATFYSQIKGTQIAVGNSAQDPSSTATLNVADTVKIYGVETELNIRVTDGLTLAASYSYLNVNAPDTIDTPLGPIFYIPSNVPKHQVGVSADYDFPLSGDTRLFLHGDYNYISGYTNNPGDVRIYVRDASQNIVGSILNVVPPTLSVSMANARAGIRGIPVGGTTVDIEGFVNNLTDSGRLPFGFSVGSSDPFISPPGGAGYGATPRTFGVLARVSF